MWKDQILTMDATVSCETTEWQLNNVKSTIEADFLAKKLLFPYRLQKLLKKTLENCRLLLMVCNSNGVLVWFNCINKVILRLRNLLFLKTSSHVYIEKTATKIKFLSHQKSGQLVCLPKTQFTKKFRKGWHWIFCTYLFFGVLLAIERKDFMKKCSVFVQPHI